MKTSAKAGIAVGIGGIAVLLAVLTSKLTKAAPAPPTGPGQGVFGVSITGSEHVFNVGRNYRFELFRDGSPLVGEQVNLVVTKIYPAAQQEMINKTYDITDNHMEFGTGLPDVKTRFVFTRLMTGETITLMCDNGVCTRM